MLYTNIHARTTFDVGNGNSLCRNLAIGWACATLLLPPEWSTPAARKKKFGGRVVGLPPSRKKSWRPPDRSDEPAVGQQAMVTLVGKAMGLPPLVWLTGWPTWSPGGRPPPPRLASGRPPGRVVHEQRCGLYTTLTHWRRFRHRTLSIPMPKFNYSAHVPPSSHPSGRPRPPEKKNSAAGWPACPSRKKSWWPTGRVGGQAGDQAAAAGGHFGWQKKN